MKLLQLLIPTYFLILCACAVRESPPGGPEDRTPPSIVGTGPENGSINLPPDAAFKIEFSEPMNRDKTEGAVFLSPVFWDFPSLEWSGKELTIVPPQNLRSNTTYILTIGADASDVHGVKIGHSQSLAFSTGATIDSGSISGTVFYESRQRVFYDIWAYVLSDTGLDFISRIPDYVTQVDSAGNFSIEHLGAGRFLVICIDDKNDDLFWDPSAEQIGLPSSFLSLGGREAIDRIVFRPMLMDTATAYVKGVEPINDRRVKIEFSEPPDEVLMLDPRNYLIRYLDGDSILATGTVYRGENEQLMLETDPLRRGVLYRLIPRNLQTSAHILFDTTGTRFTGTDHPDTTGPRLLSASPPDRSTGVYQDSVVEMTFSERILTLVFPEAVTAVADSLDTLKFLASWPLPNVARLKISGGIPRERAIEVTLNPEGIFDIYRNRMPDSAVAFTFRLPPADTVGGVIASIEPTGPGPYMGIVAPMIQGNTYMARFDASGQLNIPTILPGVYRFEYFQDADTNQKWFPGSIKPLIFAEPFSFLPDTIHVRSRWETDIGVVGLPEIRH